MRISEEETYCYRLLYPEQYEIFDAEMGVKEIARIDLEDLKYIEDLFDINLLRYNFWIKKMIYDQADKQFCSREDVRSTFNEKSSKLHTDLFSSFRESKFNKILGINYPEENISDEICSNASICIALAKSEINEELSLLIGGNTREDEILRSIFFKAFQSQNNGKDFVLSSEEKKEFLRRLFWTRSQEFFWLEEDSEFEKFLIDIIEYGRVPGREKKVDEENKDERKIDKKKSHADNVKISKYLARFCYYMVKHKRYNPILHTVISCQKMNEDKVSRRRKGTWSSFGEEEKRKICKYYQVIDYFNGKKLTCDDKKGLENYYQFVFEYLRSIKNDSLGDSEKKLNWYLFEQVFGLEYIEAVTKQIIKLLDYYKIELEDIQWEVIGKILANIMNKFEPILRIKIASLILDWYFRTMFIMRADLNESIENWRVGREKNTELEMEEFYRKLQEIVIGKIQIFLNSCRLSIYSKEKKYFEKWTEAYNDCCKKGEGFASLLKDICSESEREKLDIDVIRFDNYTGMEEYEYNTEDEQMDINDMRAEYYLKSMEGKNCTIKQKLVSCIQEECWDYSIYKF